MADASAEDVPLGPVGGGDGNGQIENNSGENGGNRGEGQDGDGGEGKDGAQGEEEGSSNPVKAAPDEWKQQARQQAQSFLPLAYWYLDWRLEPTIQHVLQHRRRRSQQGPKNSSSWLKFGQERLTTLFTNINWWPFVFAVAIILALVLPQHIPALQQSRIQSLMQFLVGSITKSFLLTMFAFSATTDSFLKASVYLIINVVALGIVSFTSLFWVHYDSLRQLCIKIFGIVFGTDLSELEDKIAELDGRAAEKKDDSPVRKDQSPAAKGLDSDSTSISGATSIVTSTKQGQGATSSAVEMRQAADQTVRPRRQGPYSSLLAKPPKEYPSPNSHPDYCTMWDGIDQLKEKIAAVRDAQSAEGIEAGLSSSQSNIGQSEPRAPGETTKARIREVQKALESCATCWEDACRVTAEDDLKILDPLLEQYVRNLQDTSDLFFKTSMTEYEQDNRVTRRIVGADKLCRSMVWQSWILLLRSATLLQGIPRERQNANQISVTKWVMDSFLAAIDFWQMNTYDWDFFEINRGSVFIWDNEGLDSAPEVAIVFKNLLSLLPRKAQNERSTELVEAAAFIWTQLPPRNLNGITYRNSRYLWPLLNTTGEEPQIATDFLALFERLLEQRTAAEIPKYPLPFSIACLSLIERHSRQHRPEHTPILPKEVLTKMKRLFEIMPEAICAGSRDDLHRRETLEEHDQLFLLVQTHRLLKNWAANHSSILNQAGWVTQLRFLSTSSPSSGKLFKRSNDSSESAALFLFLAIRKTIFELGFRWTPASIRTRLSELWKQETARGRLGKYVLLDELFLYETPEQLLRWDSHLSESDQSILLADLVDPSWLQTVVDNTIQDDNYSRFPHERLMHRLQDMHCDFVGSIQHDGRLRDGILEKYTAVMVGWETAAQDWTESLCSLLEDWSVSFDDDDLTSAQNLLPGIDLLDGWTHLICSAFFRLPQTTRGHEIATSLVAAVDSCRKRSKSDSNGPTSSWTSVQDMYACTLAAFAFWQDPTRDGWLPDPGSGLSRAEQRQLRAAKAAELRITANNHRLRALKHPDKVQDWLKRIAESYSHVF
ncbi:hypothetical protein OC846_005594 [Tilletia horrida]|uniref:Uncharacterized protein n=1 Tax=Tilletia horrida TaxID=155126 RepID=A0AAN6GKH3_9BASI|nr:hypothetical protein OC846_005594 [Tilletia horrida]KAK0562966.1 hypothetical protein OC861_005056 [Tilletia horrida]